jgi:hypothetical protein
VKEECGFAVEMQDSHGWGGRVRTRRSVGGIRGSSKAWKHRTGQSSSAMHQMNRHSCKYSQSGKSSYSKRSYSVPHTADCTKTSSIYLVVCMLSRSNLKTKACQTLRAEQLFTRSFPGPDLCTIIYLFKLIISY